MNTINNYEMHRQQPNKEMLQSKPYTSEYNRKYPDASRKCYLFAVKIHITPTPTQTHVWTVSSMGNFWGYIDRFQLVLVDALIVCLCIESNIRYLSTIYQTNTEKREETPLTAFCEMKRNVPFYLAQGNDQSVSSEMRLLIWLFTFCFRILCNA